MTGIPPGIYVGANDPCSFQKSARDLGLTTATILLYVLSMVTLLVTTADISKNILGPLSKHNMVIPYAQLMGHIAFFFLKPIS